METGLFCIVLVLLSQSGQLECRNDTLNFLVIGDGGGISFHPFTTPVQTSVAKQMASVADKEKTDFNLMLGDNFYLYGVQSVDDPRFNLTFENVYTASSLQNPWYVIAGNHDYFGNVSAQIQYTQHSERWNFPNYYYKVTKTTPGGKTVDILMIDTIILCGNVFRPGQPEGPKNITVTDVQWAWIEDNLKTSSADYFIVAGHYPVYSVAEHGPTDCLVNRLEPLLYQYNVTAYLAGHDHNLQHIQRNKNGQTMDYIGIGSGNFVDPSNAHINRVGKENLKFFWAELLYLGGFAYFEVSDSGLEFRFIDGIGTTRYQYTIQPKA